MTTVTTSSGGGTTTTVTATATHYTHHSTPTLHYTTLQYNKLYHTPPSLCDVIVTTDHVVVDMDLSSR